MVAPVAPDPEAMIWSDRPPPVDRGKGPTGSTAEEGGALVLFLHGYGGVEQDMTPFFDVLPPGAVGVSLRGPVNVRGRWAWFDPEQQARECFDAAAAGLLDWLAALPDYSSVGAVGFSQGGALALQLLRHHPHCLDYVVQICGFVMPGDQPHDRELAAVRPPVLSISGGLDDALPPEFGPHTQRWLRQHCHLTELIHPSLGHELADQVIEDTAVFLTQHLR